MKVQPIKSCSCRLCKAGRHTTRRALHRKVRRTAYLLNFIIDPDEAQDKAFPLVAGGYTD